MPTIALVLIVVFAGLMVADMVITALGKGDDWRPGGRP